MTRRDARRIVVIIFGPVCRDTHAQCAPICVSAARNRLCWRGEGASAKETYLRLLIRRESQRGSEVRHRTRHKATVIAPGESYVRRNSLPLLDLVLHLCCLLERLVVVDAEDAYRQVGVEEQAAALRREVSCARVPGD